MKSKDIKIGLAVEVAYGTSGWKAKPEYIDTGCVVVAPDSPKEYYSYYGNHPATPHTVSIQAEDGVMLTGTHTLRFSGSSKQWSLIADRNEDDTLSNFRVVLKRRLLPVGTKAAQQAERQDAEDAQNARQRESNDKVRAQAQFCVEHLPPSVLHESLGWHLRDALEGGMTYSDGSVSRINGVTVDKVNAAYVVARFFVSGAEPEVDADDLAELTIDIREA